MDKLGTRVLSSCPFSGVEMCGEITYVDRGKTLCQKLSTPGSVYYQRFHCIYIL